MSQRPTKWMHLQKGLTDDEQEAVYRVVSTERCPVNWLDEECLASD